MHIRKICDKIRLAPDGNAAAPRSGAGARGVHGRACGAAVLRCCGGSACRLGALARYHHTWRPPLHGGSGRRPRDSDL